MSSSVPYNPGDFEDNNPFTSVLDIPPPLESQAEDESSEVPAQTNASDVEGNAPVQENQESKLEGHLSETELRRLIPERFTKKYLMSIELKAIEKNKAQNPILRFEVNVKGLSKYRQEKYVNVRRTYNEVVKFNKYLTVSNLEVFVPVIALSVTSYPSGSDDETKQLLLAWQDWFDTITRNRILIRDEEFLYFVESDFGYSVINSNKKTLVATGLVRKTLKQLSVPYDPYNELADFRPLIKNMYLETLKLHKILDRHTKLEKQLSIHLFDLGNKLLNLSQFETMHPGMKNLWEKLSKIEHIQSDLFLIECVTDMGTLGDGVRNMSENFYQIKEALTNRHLIMRELTQAEQQTRTKRAQAIKIKNRASLDPLKVDEALRSLEYATKAEESLSLQVKRISGEMNFERAEVLESTELKFQKLIKNYSLHKVDHHRKILKHLESIRLDVRLVDDKGGLSRLNRNNLSTIKHNLLQSQSSSGDSWSSRSFRSLAEEKQQQKLKQEIGKENKLQTEEEEVVDSKRAAHLLGVATF